MLYCYLRNDTVCRYVSQCSLPRMEYYFILARRTQWLCWNFEVQLFYALNVTCFRNVTALPLNKSNICLRVSSSSSSSSQDVSCRLHEKLKFCIGKVESFIAYKTILWRFAY